MEENIKKYYSLLLDKPNNRQFFSELFIHKKINLSSHDIIELFMLIKDVVPGLRFIYSRQRLEELKKISNQHNLKYIIQDYKYIGISKNKEALQHIAKSDSFLFNHASKGLGFPVCCVRANKTKRLYTSTEEIPNFFQTLKNSKQQPKFYTNTLFHQSLFHLIPHFPCKFDCKESVKIGKETHSLIKEESKKLAYLFKTILSTPFLIKPNTNIQTPGSNYYVKLIDNPKNPKKIIRFLSD